MKITNLVLVGFFLLQLFAVYLVTKGFFLVMDKVPQTDPTNPIDGTDVWFERKAKVVLLIIDALRFDFFYYNKTIPSDEEEHYQNKFRKLHNFMENNPESFAMFNTYADPPTVTVQRVQSMLTGNLPPFVEITENFGSSAISEDNIIKKLVQQNRSIIQIGDYIWTDLFPTEFTKNFSCESLDIHDFDSVDDVVEKHIFPSIAENDFDLMIAHGIGVDHVGHTYSINHEKMSEKLAQMDDLVMRVISAIDNDTVLFIMGDHGMSHDGDHGGGSEEETSTVIAAYYRDGFRKYKEPALDKIMKSFNENSSQLAQMDMAPTLAMLLGLPIPASNTGHMINDLYLNKKGVDGNIESPTDFILNLARDNYVNMVQTSNYLKAVQTNFKKFPNETFIAMERGYEKMKKDYNRLKEYADKNPENYEEIRDYAVDLVEEMQDMADAVYELMKTSNSYDFQLTVMGIIVGICTLIIALLLLQYEHIHTKSADLINGLDHEISTKVVLDILFKTLTNNKVMTVFGSVLAIAISMFKVEALKIATVFIILLALRVIIMLGVQVVKKTKVVLRGPQSYKWIFLFDSPLSTLLALSIVVLGVVIRFSVYLTRLEGNFLQDGILIITVFVIIIELFKPQASFTSISKTKIIATLVLFAMTIYIMPYYDFFYYSKIAIEDDSIQAILYSSPIKVIVPLIVFIQQMYLRTKKLLASQTTKFASLLGFSHSLSLISLILYFTLPVISGHDAQKGFWVQIVIPRAFYLFTFISFLLGLFEPNPSSDNSIAPQESNAHAHRGQTLRRFFISNSQICLLQLVFLLAGPNAIMSFTMIYLAMDYITYYFSNRHPQSLLFQLMITVVSLFGYFCTGHTNQVTNIQVSQGFVGFDKYSLLLSGPLVLINTMGSFIVGMVFMSNLTHQIREKTELPQRIKQEKVGLWKELWSLRSTLLYMVFYLCCHCSTSINCLKNHSSLLLVYDFAPKYLIDTAIYGFLIIVFMVFRP